MGAREDEDCICVLCREEPEVVARCLLKLARAGDPELGLLARYELGRGGTGAVYLARHVTTGEQIALKLVLPGSAGTPNGRARFLRETTLASSLRHRNILESYGALNAAGAYCFASEYCRGGSLSQFLDHSRRRLSVKRAISLFLQVLDGLNHAHRSGVVHRDLAPGNILLGKGGNGATVAKVGDFGVGKLFDQAGLSGLTRTGDAAGKPAYVPRQQVVNFRYAKPAVDVWAAAACLYCTLTGTCPRDFSAAGTHGTSSSASPRSPSGGAIRPSRTASPKSSIGHSATIPTLAARTRPN
jgi:serine/threonine protein kinase